MPRSTMRPGCTWTSSSRGSRASLTNAKPYYHLAQFYRMNGDQERALGLLLESVRLDPAHAEAHVSLAEVYAIRGDYEAARKHAAIAEENGDRAPQNCCAATERLSPGGLPLPETLGDLDYTRERVRELPADRGEHIPDGGGRSRLHARSTMPSRSSLRRQSVNTFGETPRRSVFSSVKQRWPPRRNQMTCAVQAEPSRRMHSD